MSNDEFDKKTKEIEDNFKVIEAYDKMYEQMKKMGQVIGKNEVKK